MSIWEQGPDRTDHERERAGGKGVVGVVLLLVVLVGGGWAAAYLVADDDLPRGATVADVAVGGRSQDAAVDALRAGLADTVDSPIEVEVGSRAESVDPADAGLAVDYEASVAQAGGGRSWNPQDLWDHYIGGEDLDAVVTVDDDAMAALVEDLSEGLGTEPRDGAVSFVGGAVRVRDPEAGRGLDPDATREALVAAYLTGETAELSATTLQPAIEQSDIDEALRSFANPALSAPVTLVLGEESVRLSPRQYADALSLRAEDGFLVPTVDRRALARLVRTASDGAGAPVDARIEVVRGTPRVVPAQPGVAFAPDDVDATFLDVLTRAEGKRSAEVPSTVARADLTTQEARDLRVREQVSEFETYFPYAEYRNINIGRAAEIVDGTLLMPGDTFSMNDIVGERTRENGFTEGFVISNGIFAEDLGGGVSQMATTLFNAMFFAGLEDVEHKPHSFYIDRYPVGREATVAFGSVDLRFRNDTDTGVLVEAEVIPSTPSSQGTVRVTMYGTKRWDVGSRTSGRYAYVAPETRTLDTVGCYANTGYSGFQVDVTRVFRPVGESDIARREVFHTDYTASDTVICVPPGSLSQPPPDEGGNGNGNGGGNGNGNRNAG